MKLSAFLLAGFLAFSVVGWTQPAPDSVFIRQIYNTALTESHGMDWLEHLCLRIGHRLSGSPQAAKAVEYGYYLMDSLGLEAEKQPVMVPHWQRGASDHVIATVNGQNKPLHALALGGSVAGQVSGPVIEISNWQDLKNMPPMALQGAIAFFNEPMSPTNLYTFASYGHCVKQRWAGASEAAALGAVGAVVRSLTTRIDTFPHTGSMKYEGQQIPAAAISTADAEWLHLALSSEKSPAISMNLTCQTLPDAPSHNVVGEWKTEGASDRIILVGGHLDSWDVGHGAHDDGAGVMQSLAAVEILRMLGYKPQNTIRVVFFMNEENGLRGATAYAERAAERNEIHLAAIESDRGAFTPRGFHFEGEAQAVAQACSWQPVLEEYGLHDLKKGGSGADVKPLQTEHNLLAGYVPDSQRYFDHHHAATDTFDTVNKREFELGAASLAALIYLIDIGARTAQ